MNFLVKENYFDNPDHIRSIGLSLNNYRTDNDPNSPVGGWRGKRSLPFRMENVICPCCHNTIKHFTEIDKLLNEESKKIFNICVDYFNLQSDYLTITTYFHITNKNTIHSLPDFWQDRFHKDYDDYVAGIVYLTPDAPPRAGTSILDGKNNKFLNIENKYNRLVAYESDLIHGISDVFGDTDENSRLTFTFFIHDISEILNHD